MTFLRLSRRTYAFLTTLSTSAQRMRSPALVEAFSRPSLSLTRSSAAGSRLLSSSSFQAPEPPSSKGIAIFPDVDISTSQPITEFAKQRNQDPDAVFVVNGASRGIGLQMVKSLLERTQGKIVACCRNPAALDPTLTSNDRIDTFALDLEDQSTIDGLEHHLKTNHNKRVDGLFNVAGILGDGETTPGPERSLARMERDWLEHTLQVNVVGHVMLIKALRTMLKSGKERPKSVIVNLSARVGSISDNELGGWYSYRLSKAALNQATRTMAHELKRQGTHTIAIHPGTTDTDLSKPFQKNVKKEKLFPVDFTVNQILDVVDHLGDEHTGGLYDWAGKAIPF